MVAISDPDLKRLCENEVFIAFFCCGIYAVVKNEIKYWALALNASKLRAKAQYLVSFFYYGINAEAKKRNKNFVFTQLV